MHSKRKGPDEDDMKAAKEEELKELKAAGAKEDDANNCVKGKMGKLDKLNDWDGLVHNGDGTKDFVEGGRVGGVNTALAQAKGAHKTRKEEQEDKEAEDEEKNAVANESKQVAAQAEAAHAAEAQR